jgi:hypothetical protein
MSLRPPPPPALDPDVELEVPDPPEAPDSDDPDEDVEYFVDVDSVSSVWTSVPKSAQSPQTSSSAPSILTVFGDPVSAPHISHWTISALCRWGPIGFSSVPAAHPSSDMA